MAFPDGFLWGGSSSASQIEGGWDLDGRAPSILDVKKLNPGCCSFHYASDFYHHYKEDIALMAEMGFKAFRMSISWSRVMPTGEGEVNQAGIDFYKDVFAECHKYGIEPVVTIYHFDLPLALREKYHTWQDRRMADAYVEYCRVLFENYRDDVKYWLTYNEQNMLIYFCAADMNGTGVTDLKSVYDEAHVQLWAQARAIKLCHEMCPDSKIGPAPNITTTLPATASPEDYLAALNNDDLRNNFYLDALCWGRYPKSTIAWLAHQGVELDIREGEMEMMASCHPDFIGFNCYANDTVEHIGWIEQDLSSLVGADNSKMSYLMALMEKPGIGRAIVNEYRPKAPSDGHPFDPWCIRITARRLTDRYGLPVLITENGYGRPDTLEEDGTVHDQYRIEHLRETIRQMEIGIAEGADIMGYCSWSAVDLVSTREGCTKRYGFVYVDRTEDDDAMRDAPMKRYRKDSFYWYKKVIESNGADLD